MSQPTQYLIEREGERKEIEIKIVKLPAKIDKATCKKR